MRETRVGDALDAATLRLERCGVPAARFDAEVLLARQLGTDRGGLRVRAADALDGESAASFERALARRERREPLQHITGVREFHGLELRCDRRALVPRAETEGVVDAALEILRSAGSGAARAADLGTGSGCIAVALAVGQPRLELHALDSSAEALDLARENAALHGVAGRIELRAGDLAAPPAEWLGRMDVVVSNPPYVAEDEWRRLEPEVREFDPRPALVPGPSGLEAYPALGRSARGLLRDGGTLVAEVGYGQAEAVRGILAQAGLEPIEVRPDLSGIPRVAIARKAGAA